MDKFIKEEKYNAIKEMWTSAFQELVKVEVSIELNQTTALTMISPESMQQRGQVEAQVAKMKSMVKTQEQIVQRLEKRLLEAKVELEQV